jgi:hypothetical protein
MKYGQITYVVLRNIVIYGVMYFCFILEREGVKDSLKRGYTRFGTYAAVIGVIAVLCFLTVVRTGSEDGRYVEGPDLTLIIEAFLTMLVPALYETYIGNKSNKVAPKGDDINDF